MSEPTCPQSENGPFTVNQVIDREVRALRPSWLADFTPATWGDENASENLKRLYTEIHERADAPAGVDPEESGPLSALCLSGGGIRSATFNLGVIQTLARSDLLDRFDYLSSVSGGGYIASWLRTWMYREGKCAVIAQLKGDAALDPMRPEPAPVRTLRDYSNYLTPRLGLFSGDTWAAAAMVLRNLLVNWLVIVPLLIAVTAFPLMLLVVVKSSRTGMSWAVDLLWVALALELVASLAVYLLRRFAKDPGISQASFIVWCVGPIWLAAALLCWAALDLPWLVARRPPTSGERWSVLGFSAIWCIAVPLLGWMTVEVLSRLGVRLPGVSGDKCKQVVRWRRSMLFEGIGLLASGVIASLVLTGVTLKWLADLADSPALFVVLAVPMLLGVYLFARVLFVAIASRAEATCTDWWKSLASDASTDDADREWWARLSGWILLIATFWMVATSISFIAAYVLEQLDTLATAARAAVGGVGGTAGLVTALIASAEKSPGADGSRPPSALRSWAMASATPLFVVCSIVLITWLSMWLGELATGTPDVFCIDERNRCLAREYPWSHVGWLTLLIVSMIAGSIFAGLIVNVNRFSLHGMYRNRLVRAYLGASNRERRADPFTGFALTDNTSLHELWHDAAKRPLPIINAALNLVRGTEHLAWQERKAESFSMTPFYCGNYQEGYRYSQHYGGARGISVGTAVTISGAAANPNMGYNSSPPLAFLMTLFNLRLGAWLGNTNEHGKRAYKRSGPRQALGPLLAELLGQTSSSGRYVNLSDGGHFDNLGLYEVVLRRCRYILVSDAGQDDKFAFEDLGNAIRKIRIDFGIRIEFERKIRILPRKVPVGTSPDAGFYCATARIRYGDVDRTANGAPAPDGMLVYIKPTLLENVPYDVYSYSQGSQMFPHEPTSDQWFSESQFESYRALGCHIAGQLVAGIAPASVGEFIRDLNTRICEIAAHPATGTNGATAQTSDPELGVSGAPKVTPVAPPAGA